MENENMNHTEFVAFLQTIAENIRLKAKTGEEAAKIIEDLIEKMK